jgi:cytochrome c
VSIFPRRVLALITALLVTLSVAAQEYPAAGDPAAGVPAAGDAERGRLIFGPCRTCHTLEASKGHGNGPNLHRIFGKVAGKQPGFNYYSELFKNMKRVWTPQFMYRWLENPRAMFPESSMMSQGVSDPQQRADLIAYLKQASVGAASTGHARVVE